MARVSDILITKGPHVHAIDPGATVYEAIAKMVACNVGSLMVREGDRVLGIFTERDYLRRVTLQDRHPRTTYVSEVMTERLVCVETHQDVTECMRIMSQERIRHLPVVNEGGLVGMISIGDLVKCMASERAVEVRYLTEYIMGERTLS